MSKKFIRPSGLATDLEEHAEPSNIGGRVPSSQRPSSIDSDGEPRSRRQRSSPSLPSVKQEPEPSDPGSSSSSDSEDGPNDEMAEDTNMNERTNSVDASDFKFTGKTEELSQLLMDFRLKKILDPDLRNDDEAQCAYLATTFQGKVMTWFVSAVESDDSLLTDPEVLVEKLKATYGETEEVRQAKAQARVTHLKHTTTVQAFAAEFEALAEQLSWPDSARQAFFYQGLKTTLKEQLIHSSSIADYTSLRSEATRVEAMMAVAHVGTTPSSGSKKSRKKKAAKKAASSKCGKCGRTNHETKDCYAKTTVNAVRVSGEEQTRPSWQERTISIGGKELMALIDTGSPVSCIRRNLASGPISPSNQTLLNPDGSILAQLPYFITAIIDDEPVRLYMVENLQEEVILGRDHIESTVPANVLAIRTTGPIPASGKAKRLSTKEQEAEQEFIHKNLSSGRIRPSLAQRPANLLFVPKKNGKLRPCVDYRPLNSVLVADRYPLPLISELTDRARGSHFYTLIDIEEAFYHIAIRPGDEPKTAFSSSQGVFEFTVMPFGISSGPSAFQRFVDEVLIKQKDFTARYIDDILIFGENPEQLMRRELDVRAALINRHVSINEDKVIRNVREVKFLGMRVGNGKVTPDPDTATISDWPAPTNKKELQSFLGLANYYRGHIPGLASLAAPLYEKTGKNDWTWTMADGMCFSQIKTAVVNSMATYDIDYDKPFHLIGDASLFGVGAILLQDDRPVQIISRSLSHAERNYSTTERELLPIVYAAKKWRYIFESTPHPILVLTDHLAIAQQLNKDNANRRINRWMEILMPYRFLIRHTPGITNPADAPSRRPDYEYRFGGGGGGKCTLLVG